MVLHFQFNSDGSPYKTERGFTCKVQVAGFRALLEEMSARPQDYVSEHGRLTTNSVEGFHGMALVYRDKRTDLGHTHYTCKTNMAICHKVRITVCTNTLLKFSLSQNLGPIWKVFCLMNMGVDIPVAAAASILKEQEAWEADKLRRSSNDNLRTRCLFVLIFCI